MKKTDYKKLLELSLQRIQELELSVENYKQDYERGNNEFVELNKRYWGVKEKNKALTGKVQKLSTQKAVTKKQNELKSLGYCNVLLDTFSKKLSVSNLFEDYPSAISHKYSQNKRVYTFEAFMPELDIDAYLEACKQHEIRNSEILL